MFFNRLQHLASSYMKLNLLIYVVVVSESLFAHLSLFLFINFKRLFIWYLHCPKAII